MNSGTIFKLTTGGTISVVHTFSNDRVESSLVVGGDGTLYVAGAFGRVYQATPAGIDVYSIGTTGAVTKIITFDRTIGCDTASLCPLPDGRFVLTALDGGAQEVGSIVRLTTTPPATPNGVGISPRSASMLLFWPQIPTATSYNLYRSTTPDDQGTTPYRTNITSTTFTDTGLTNGVTYYYRLSAVNEAGEGGQSTQLVATPRAPTASFAGIDVTTQGNWRDRYSVWGFNVIGDTSSGNPYYREGVSVTPGTHNSGVWAASSLSPACLQPAMSSNPNRLAGVWFQTSWTMNVNMPSGSPLPLELYLLDFANSGYAETITITDAVTGTVLNTQTASNFAGGKYYIWNVSGNVNVTFTATAGHWAVLSGIFVGGGTGSKSPTQPTNLVATPTASGIGLNWTASTGAASYNVYRGTSPGGESTTPIATGIKTTSFANTGLAHGVTYYYKVVALNSYAGSFASTEASATAP
jgi:fibronectin type 3 domain-containing protein